MSICDNCYMLYILVNSLLRRTTRTNCHLYVLLPPHDGLLASLKHVEVVATE
jgi:hypothetical protein